MRQSTGRSVLPAETYRPGSAPSGCFTGTTTPIAAPFPGQPVQLLVNLMAVPDPGGIGGFGLFFSVPFVTSRLDQPLDAAHGIIA